MKGEHNKDDKRDNRTQYSRNNISLGNSNNN